MSTAIEKLQLAQKWARENRPKVDGFAYFAEVLRRAGVKRNVRTLPSCQGVYYIDDSVVVQQMKPLIEKDAEFSQFNKTALVQALRDDQEGKSSFPEFLQSVWNAGVLWYDIDFEKRIVTYGGARGEMYSESYPEVLK